MLANQRTVDAAKKDFRDTINFGKQIGQDLKTDFFDTVDFFTPQQAEQPMMTNIPMRRPDQMFPIRSVTETTGMPFMDQIPDMFPDNQGQPTYTPEAAGFGLDSLMQPQQIQISPGMGLNVVTDREGNPITYGTNPDDIMQGGFIGFSGTGPISVDFDTMGQPLTQRQMEILRRN